MTLTPELKQRIREVWEAQPGLFGAGQDINHPERHTDSGELRCAILSLPGKLQSAISDREADTIMQVNDEGLAAADGVTPEERRDCMIAMLDAGAFDDLD